MQELHPNLYTQSIPHKMLFFHFGTRMTVVRLTNGDLWLHSPIPLTDELKQELDAYGKVRYLIAPNAFHHLYVGDYQAAYPEAQFFGPKILTGKRKDLQFDGHLGKLDPIPWAEEIDEVSVSGMPPVSETVFYHKASKTLIMCDLVFNIKETAGIMTMFYLWFSGMYKKPGVSRLIRAFTRDKTAARRDMRRVFEWDIQRVLMTHGEPMEVNAKKALEEAFEWL